MSHILTTLFSHRIITRWKLSGVSRKTFQDKVKVKKSYDIEAEEEMREKTEVKDTRSGHSYAKYESSDEFAARHLRFSPLCVPPCTFPHPERKSVWRFSFDATSAFALRPPSLFKSTSYSSFLGAPRVKGSRYRSFPSKFAKPRIKRRIELCE